jgi:hypothetical protein
MTADRVRNVALLAVVAAFALLAVSYLAGNVPFDIYSHPIAVDLTAHLAGGQIARAGDLSRLYDVNRQWQAEQSLLGARHPEFLDLFVSPPFVAFVYLPLAGSPSS